MLRSLDIRDMLIIERLELEFQPGLNVLTGETGAGKSILLDALGFVLGWRGRAELVRTGAVQGEVIAEFELPAGHPAHAILEEAGLPAADDGTLILRRINTTEGRKTAWINDRRASGEVLRALSDTLVELHGQQDDKGVLNPRGHRVLLDAFIAAEEALAATRKAWRTFGDARTELAETEARLAELREEEDFLRHAVTELDALAPEPGEEASLDATRRLMQAAERVRGDILRAHAALGGDGAEGQIADALRWMDDAAAATEGRLDPPIAALGQALEALGEAEQGVARCLEEMSVDPGKLEATEERLFAIRALARKHSVQPDALGEIANELRQRLTALDGAGEDLSALAEALDRAETAYLGRAAALSKLRRAGAARLDAAMAEELAPLKMEQARFTTDMAATDPGPEGNDTVQFTVATNPGAPAGPLNKIASGGELSRFLLALKLCLHGQADSQTMIFDEIDRGVGGATADAVGRRLARMAEGAQVLVVTHSPQVAARAAHHWRVEKRVAGGLTTSHVTPLMPEDRVGELARMLAGDTITDEARDAARALLSG